MYTISRVYILSLSTVFFSILLIPNFFTELYPPPFLTFFLFVQTCSNKKQAPHCGLLLFWLQKISKFNCTSTIRSIRFPIYTEAVSVPGYHIFETPKFLGTSCQGRNRCEPITDSVHPWYCLTRWHVIYCCKSRSRVSRRPLGMLAPAALVLASAGAAQCDQEAWTLWRV